MYFYVITNNLMREKEKHWENIYETKKLDGVSWFQKKPLTSLSLIEISNINKDAEIIDVGCGKSFLIDNLLEKTREMATKEAEVIINASKEKATAESAKIAQEGDAKLAEIQSSIDANFDEAVKHVVSTVLKA